jgi:hypothetical protein
VYIYCVMTDDGTDSPGFALLDEARNPRPSYAAFKAGAA